MNKGLKMLLGTAAAAWSLAGAAHIDNRITLMATRVAADDVEAVAKFYEQAFGLKEVQRLKLPNIFEIMLNFGASVDAAKGNPATQIVVMKRAGNQARKDPVAHLIFRVTDIAVTRAAIEAAGGKMDGPKQFGETGIIIGMGTDPAGNHIELIQQPKL